MLTLTPVSRHDTADGEQPGSTRTAASIWFLRPVYAVESGLPAFMSCLAVYRFGHKRSWPLSHSHIFMAKNHCWLHAF